MPDVLVEGAYTHEQRHHVIEVLHAANRYSPVTVYAPLHMWLGE